LIFRRGGDTLPGMDLLLNGKRALVSGSSAGIGLAIARSLAAEGAEVVINGRSKERVEAAAKKIRDSGAKGEVALSVADLGTKAGVDELLRQVPAVDILVNNLGMYVPKPFEEITDEDWLRIIEVNVLSGIRLSRAYLPGMKKRNWGRIIFISSESGINIPVEMIHYGVTKTAQLAISRGLAETTAGTGVTVNAVLPGPTKSEGVEQFVEDMARAKKTDAASVEKEFFKSVRPSSLLKRFATPEEVAAMVTFVASPLSSATNGAALRVDGGVVRSAF
jgi:NAD(P)-dependent dehydrogenase (short-subunit alcohol dehydrogenase family)